MAEYGACAENLTHAAYEGEGKREAQAYADAVSYRQPRIVFGCESLGTSEQDAIHHNQRDEYAQ